MRVLTVASLISSIVVLLSPSANAKLLPLEVQISGPDRTVRVNGRDFFNSINVPGGTGVARYLGVFEYSAPPLTSEGQELIVSLRHLYDRRGAIVDGSALAVSRDTVLVASFVSNADGWFGQIQHGGMETFRPGRWIKFLPAFADLVNESYVSLPPVEPIEAPSYRYEPPLEEPAASLLTAINSYELLLVVGFLLLILLTIWVRRAVSRHLGRHSSSSRQSRPMQPTPRYPRAAD